MKHLKRWFKVKSWEVYTSKKGLLTLTYGDKEYVWNTFLPVVLAVLGFTVNLLFLIPCCFFLLFQLRDVEAYEAYLDKVNQKKKAK